ncbi:MAG: hypothetical protein U0736_06035 [Gemmataceae bacterium]
MPPLPIVCCSRSCRKPALGDGEQAPRWLTDILTIATCAPVIGGADTWDEIR